MEQPPPLLEGCSIIAFVSLIAIQSLIFSIPEVDLFNLNDLKPSQTTIGMALYGMSGTPGGFTMTVGSIRNSL